MMRNIKTIFSGMSLLLALLSLSLTLQAQSPTFLLLERIRVDSQQEARWLALNDSLRTHLEMLDDDFVDRVLLRLWYPHPGEEGYHYLLITEYRSFESLQYSSITYLQRFGKPMVQPLLEEQRQLATVVSREITSSYWRQHLVVRSEEEKDVVAHLHQGDWVMFQYLKVDPDNWGPYSTMEEHIWKPIHEANVEKGILKFWTLLGYYYESRKIDYDLVAVLVYPSFNSLELNIYTHDTWIAVHGSENDVFNQTFANREQVQANIWKVVDALHEK